MDISQDNIQLLIDMVGKASDAGASVAIWWLVVPLIQTLLTSCGFVAVVAVIIQGLIRWLNHDKATKLAIANQPQVSKLKYLLLGESTELELEDILRKQQRRVGGTGDYVGNVAISKLKETLIKAWEDQDKTRP